MTENVSYSIVITRHDEDGRASIDWEGYGLLHELLADAMERAAEFGWLADWPELPTPKLLRSEGRP